MIALLLNAFVQVANAFVQWRNYRIQKAHAERLYRDFIRQYGYPPY
ncbi:hypothetical protein [Hymenobacter sp. YC55]|nr:hypothetical protein [Hymenobacter sp. YC55]MDF7810488.1 hypothetical protein [Hymenobacter sp. YC55]